ncbi:unnamed protein product [Mytilus edulis]|uniref:Uncharacterized protein n=1 Tax=Mytilus edulis TaxID=6550 RepID=A0A8S3QMN7_MYTED|nr:unnamed protein product [Mytilus edulis]CAG2198130.1 unnamed protein product [Mytilus edulis]
MKEVKHIVPEDTVNFKEMKTLVIWMIFSIVPLHQASEQTVYTFGQNCSVVITVNPEDEIYVLYEGGSLSSACDTFQFKHNSTLCITSLNHDDPDCAVELQYYIKNDSRTPEKRYTCTNRPDEDDYCVKEKETMFLKLQSLSYNRQNVTIKLRIKLIEVEETKWYIFVILAAVFILAVIVIVVLCKLAINGLTRRSRSNGRTYNAGADLMDEHTIQELNILAIYGLTRRSRSNGRTYNTGAAPANKYMPSNGAYPTQTSGQQTTNFSNEPAGYNPSSTTWNYSTPQDFSAFTYNNPVS